MTVGRYYSTGLGDKEGDLTALEKVYAAHDLQPGLLKIDPNLDSLHAEP